jgi:hypothetical protein
MGTTKKSKPKQMAYNSMNINKNIKSMPVLKNNLKTDKPLLKNEGVLNNLNPISKSLKLLR